MSRNGHHCRSCRGVVAGAIEDEEIADEIIVAEQMDALEDISDVGDAMDFPDQTVLPEIALTRVLPSTPEWVRRVAPKTPACLTHANSGVASKTTC